MDKERDMDKNKERDVEMPKVASREAWLRAQGASHEGEGVEPPARCAERRKLPMVRIEKDYVFEGPERVPARW
jgi:predicted dithiol-disulfide oxidoreductase (DUF899 family)